MIVNQVDVEHLAVFEPEYDPPIGSDGHCPLARAIALQAMEAKARGIDVFDGPSHVQPSQDPPDLIDVFGAKFASVVFFKQGAQPFMPKAANHGISVK